MSQKAIYINKCIAMGYSGFYINKKKNSFFKQISATLVWQKKYSTILNDRKIMIFFILCGGYRNGRHLFQDFSILLYKSLACYFLKQITIL